MSIKLSADTFIYLLIRINTPLGIQNRYEVVEVGMFANELTQTVVLAFRSVVSGLPVPLLRVMTAIHPVTADVVDHVEGELGE